LDNIVSISSRLFPVKCIHYEYYYIKPKVHLIAIFLNEFIWIDRSCKIIRKC